MTPEERFIVEELERDEKDRRGWGLRDQATGELATAGGEIDRYGTPDQARMHIQSHWYHAQRAERHRAVEAHIEQFATDAAHRRDGALGPSRRSNWWQRGALDVEAGRG